MTTKGWRKRAPKTAAERRALLARCGAKAFLDPKNLKYPVMAKNGACVVDCAGAQAAENRARQQKRPAVFKKAARVATACDLVGGRGSRVTLGSTKNTCPHCGKLIRKLRPGVYFHRCTAGHPEQAPVRTPQPPKPLNGLPVASTIAYAGLAAIVGGISWAAWKVYKATAPVSGPFVERIPGGRASGRRPEDFDPRQLAAGIRVEMEHTRNWVLAREIAMDHLTEYPDYYTRLMAAGL